MECSPVYAVLTSRVQISRFCFCVTTSLGPHGVGGCVPPILQMKKLRVRSVTGPSLLQQSWDLDPGQHELAPFMAQTS